MMIAGLKDMLIVIRIVDLKESIDVIARIIFYLCLLEWLDK